MRAALYARVSTRDKGQDPETQLMPLRRYAELREFTIAGVYVDVGISGAKSRRPQLDRLMADARKRHCDIVIVARFDRFGRSVTHLLGALEEFSKLGVDFVSMNESMDTTTASGRLLFTVIGAVAEFEREIIRERVLMGVDRARKQGKQLGRPKRIVDRDRVCALYTQYRSVRKVAAMVGVSKNKVAALVNGL